jgi:glycosyltransferase involved in cell wall biosynthesis
MHITQLNYVYDPDIRDPEALLDRYATLTGWSEALLSAGASRATVVQRFGRNADVTRRGVHYVFRSDGPGTMPRPWRWRSRLHGAVATLAPDVVHINGLNLPMQMVGLRGALPETTLIVQDHVSRSPERPRPSLRSALRARIWRAGLGSIDGLFFTAKSQADAWRDSKLLGEQPVYEVLESSTSIEAQPRAAARRESGMEGDPAILWAGRLNSNKDPITVLDGFERSIDALPRATLTMVYGAADLLPEVEARVRSSPVLQGRVVLAGRKPHSALSSYFSAADVFILGSHHEAAGYALIEACACGAVPVVTDIPAFRAITAGSIGALWRVGDASDCSRAIVGVCRGDLSAASARVRAHFDRSLSWDAVGRTALDAYRDARSRARGREFA